MYESTAKIFRLKQVSKSLYIIETLGGLVMTTPRTHGTVEQAMEWARAWASSWPNTQIVYEG